MRHLNEKQIAAIEILASPNRGGMTYKEIAEYVYDSEKSRSTHVAFMTMHGWNVGERQKRLKVGADIVNPIEEDYEWYAEFYRSRI